MLFFAIIHLTREPVRQIKDKALERLRHSTVQERLKLISDSQEVQGNVLKDEKDNMPLTAYTIQIIGKIQLCTRCVLKSN